MYKKKRVRILLIFSLFILNISLTGSSKIEQKITPGLLNSINKKGTHHQFIVWIFFNDKGPFIQKKIETIKLSLTSHAIKRRLRHRGLNYLVDEYDVAVNKKYIERIREKVNKIRHESHWLNAVSVEASGNAIREIAESPFVKKIDKVIIYHFPREPKIQREVCINKQSISHITYKLDYGNSFSQVNQINVPKLHDMGYSGDGVIICMLDSGFNNLIHEALDQIDIAATWDFVNNDANVFDESGQMGTGNHGTWTLGSIAGFFPGKLIGPAYGATFLLGKTENTGWERHIEEDHWIAGAEWADKLGADIISSSLGYRNEFTHNENNYTWKEMDGKTTIVTKGANIAASRGILIVNSAGNAGESIPPQNNLIAPADSPKVLAIGAVDSLGERASFSSTGPTADRRIKPDVMARGVNVYTADVNAINQYTLVSGTSLSCPLTAGVAALILEINPNWTNMEIIDAIKQTSNNSGTPDNYFGWGIVNAFKAAFYNKKNIYPPINLSLEKIENNFIFFVEYIDKLSWEANSRNNAPIKYYRIYFKRLSATGHEYELIVELNGEVHSHYIRGINNKGNLIYKIVSVNEEGEESEPNFILNY